MKTYFSVISPIYLLSIIFSISSNSWLSMWIGMEINLLTFIFILFKNKTINSTESTMKYYLVQTSGSLIFLITMSYHTIYCYETFSINALIPPLALMLKSGMAPLHSWMPSIGKKISPESLFLLITLQKIIPLMIIFSSWSSFLKWLVPMNILIGSIGGLNQSSINQLLIFSSINNSGWMLMSLLQSNFLFLLFFFIYFMLNFITMMFIKKNKIKWIIQIKSSQFSNKIWFSSIMLSLSGLPPLCGFFPKWMILKKSFYLIPILCLTSTICASFTMFFYIKSSINLILNSQIQKKWNLFYNNFTISNTIFIFNFFSSPLFIFLT